MTALNSESGATGIGFAVGLGVAMLGLAVLAYFLKWWLRRRAPVAPMVVDASAAPPETGPNAHSVITAREVAPSEPLSGTQHTLATSDLPAENANEVAERGPRDEEEEIEVQASEDGDREGRDLADYTGTVIIIKKKLGGRQRKSTTGEARPGWKP